MDKILKCEFYVSTRFVGSDVREIVEVTIPEGTPIEKEDDIVKEWFEEWVWETIENSYNIIEDYRPSRKNNRQNKEWRGYV
jgi:hypothetical protein